MRIQLWPCSPCEVFCLVFDLWFFLMLRRPRCFVTTAVLFLTDQLKKKKKKRKKRFVPRPCFFPASRKTTPSSVARCFVRISGRPSFAVIELPSDYPQWSAVEKETGKFHGSHSRRRASRLRQEAEATWRGCSVFAIKRKQVVRASPD